MRVIRVVNLAGLEIQAGWEALGGLFLVWAGSALVAASFLRADAGSALALGALVALAHTMVGLVHHYGHAIAAARTGYPMRGVRLGRLLVLGESLYPEPEPPLPGRVHIRRALGGPIASLTLALVAGLVAWRLEPAGGPAFGLAAFVSLDSLLVYTLGVLLPLGFTDMSTIVYWWNR